MNASHVVSASGAVGLLTEALIYLTHWPWQPMSTDSASAFAGLIVMVGAPWITKLLPASPPIQPPPQQGA